MRAYPLESVSLRGAMEKQFALVDIITKHFSGSEFLSTGDLGLNTAVHKPVCTETAEKVLAEFFHAEACMLTRGAGTQAIRWGLMSALRPSDCILVHSAPMYPTTEVSVASMGLRVVRADFNDDESIVRALRENDIALCLVQHTRQTLDDAYDLQHVIDLIKNAKQKTVVLVDDNYAVMKTEKIGCECGADLSAFSLFKLLGPVGIGCLVGKKSLIDTVCAYNYSGGGQVQGFESMEALRSLVYAPVALAIQAEQNDRLLRELNDREKFPYVRQCLLANAQSKVLLVEFDKPVAQKVLAAAERLGALPYPVGAESKFEVPPLFYRVSGTFLKKNPELRDTMIRINPNRSGAQTIIRILDEAYKAATAD